MTNTDWMTLLSTEAQEELSLNIESFENSLFSTDGFVEMMKEIGFNSEKPIPEIVKTLTPLRQHLESYWTLSKQFFNSGNYALACLFSITLIEECAKTSILFWIGCELKTEAARQIFYKHEKKYLYAAIYNIAMNGRVYKIYGNETKRKFEQLCKNGRLFKIRNQALYFDTQESGHLAVPSNAITKELAALPVFIGGEIYAVMVFSPETVPGIMRKSG